MEDEEIAKAVELKFKYFQHKLEYYKIVSNEKPYLSIDYVLQFIS